MIHKQPAGMPDSMAISGEVLIPIVLLKSSYKDSKNFIGFIPGFLMKNIVNEDEQLCKQKVKEYLINKLKLMKENNEVFPFFPTKEEIMKEYDNVYSVDFVKVKSDERKN